MKIARYWARATSRTAEDGTNVVSRGWSDRSMQEALQIAKERADRLLDRLLAGDLRGQRYEYGRSPLPEPVLNEFKDRKGELLALVTRNSYGAHVMNTSQLMFIDIDIKPTQRPSGIGSFFKSLFKGSEQERPDTSAEEGVARVRSLIERERLGGRVYRTRGGLRVMITDRTLQPGSREAEDLLRRFDADPLYCRLCKLQESFRARLTPKPWRCGLGQPPVSFPFMSSKEEKKFADWDERYKAACQPFAVCSFLGHFGASSIDDSFRPLIEEHDRLTRSESALDLA